jgi:hypothetical protein
LVQFNKRLSRIAAFDWGAISVVRIYLNTAMTVGGMILLFAVLALGASRLESGEMLVRYSVRLALTWYLAALLLMMTLRPEDWSAATYIGCFARWCWTWGIICFATHLVMAFHFYHFWSHSHAVEVTRTVSGVGEGIYALYAFISLWTVDAAWWWISSHSYANRSRRIDLALHAFLLFIVFNGMIVFERGFIRWAGVAMFAVLGGFSLFQRRRQFKAADRLAH